MTTTRGSIKRERSEVTATSEEVLDERRGMTTRARRRNSLNIDNDNIVTTKDDICKSLTKKSAMKDSAVGGSLNRSIDVNDASSPFEPKIRVRSNSCGESSNAAKRHKEQRIRSQTPSDEQPLLKQSNNKVSKKRGSSTSRSTPSKNRNVREHKTPERKQRRGGESFETPEVKPIVATIPSPDICATSARVKVEKRDCNSDSGSRHHKQDKASSGSVVPQMEMSIEDWKQQLGSNLLVDFESGRSMAERELLKYNAKIGYDPKRTEKEKKSRREDKKYKKHERRHKRHQHQDLVSTMSHAAEIPPIPMPPVSMNQYVAVRSFPSQSPTEHLRDAENNQRIAINIGTRLRNLLKLPKAHRWACYEFFYSSVDRVLLDGQNDFQVCLNDLFPSLKTRMLTRAEWCNIRKYMGRPRRFSQKFLDEERLELERRRLKIRLMQQRKLVNFEYKELPDVIPLQLVVGTAVTARLRKPQDGLFTGKINGFDTSNSTYRVTFDRAGLGTYSIPDYEVLSNEPLETVPTSSFALKIPYKGGGSYLNPRCGVIDGIFPDFPRKSPFPYEAKLGGFSIRLLEAIVRLSKLLKSKRDKIYELKELNVKAEVMHSYSKPRNSDFRLEYARCVIDLETINKDLALYMEQIQYYYPEIGANSFNPIIIPENIRMHCKEEAELIVCSQNFKPSGPMVNNPRTVELISNLASLMLQIKVLSLEDRNRFEVKGVKDTVAEIKASLAGNNVKEFQERIEIPINQIQAGLCVAKLQKVQNKNH